VDDGICTLDILLTHESARGHFEQKRRNPSIAECLDLPEISTLPGSILNLRKLLQGSQNVKMTAA
jgi:hypothetical protein